MFTSALFLTLAVEGYFRSDFKPVAREFLTGIPGWQQSKLQNCIFTIF
jgi:hypothetical protein